MSGRLSYVSILSFFFFFFFEGEETSLGFDGTCV